MSVCLFLRCSGLLTPDKETHTQEAFQLIDSAYPSIHVKHCSKGARFCVCFVIFPVGFIEESVFVLEVSSLVSTPELWLLQALHANIKTSRQEAVDLKVHMDAELARLQLQLDAAVKKNTMLDQQLNTELEKKRSQLEAETKTSEGLRLHLRGEEKKSSLLHQQLHDEMKKNRKLVQRLNLETQDNSKVMQQLDAELKKNVWLLQRLETEQRKNSEAEQQRRSDARTIRQLIQQITGQMKQNNANFDRWEARSAAMTKHRQKQVSALKSELDSMSQLAQAEAKKLQQQLTEAQAEAKSAAQQIVSLSSQLTLITHQAGKSEEVVQMVLEHAQAVASAQKLQQISLLSQLRQMPKSCRSSCQVHLPVMT